MKSRGLGISLLRGVRVRVFGNRDGNKSSGIFLILIAAAGLGLVSCAGVTKSSNPAAGAPGTPSPTGASPHSVELSWNPSTTAQVGYYVYRGTAAGGPYAKQTLSPIFTPKFTDANVAGGASYSYVVTAVNAENVESTYSNEVVVAIP